MKFGMELEEHTPSNTYNPCAECVLRSGFMYCLDKTYCNFEKTGKTWKKKLDLNETEKYFKGKYG